MNIAIFDRLYPMDKQAEGIAVAAAAATGVCDMCEFFQECISNKNFVFPKTAWCSKKKEEIIDDLLNRRGNSRNG
jgi:hypothetical protein